MVRSLSTPRSILPALIFLLLFSPPVYFSPVLIIFVEPKRLEPSLHTPLSRYAHSTYAHPRPKGALGLARRPPSPRHRLRWLSDSNYCDADALTPIAAASQDPDRGELPSPPHFLATLPLPCPFRSQGNGLSAVPLA